MTRIAACLAGLLLTSAPLSTLHAQRAPAAPTADAGAAIADCQRYMAEVAAMAEPGVSGGEGAADMPTTEEAAKPKKKGLLGFAKKFAGAAAPMVLGGIGGGSMLGMLASQGAGAALSGGGGLGIDAPSAAGVSTAKQAKMVELARSGAGRSCAGIPMGNALAGLAPPAK